MYSICTNCFRQIQSLYRSPLPILSLSPFYLLYSKRVHGGSAEVSSPSGPQTSKTKLENLLSIGSICIDCLQNSYSIRRKRKSALPVQSVKEELHFVFSLFLKFPHGKIFCLICTQSLLTLFSKKKRLGLREVTT